MSEPTMISPASQFTVMQLADRAEIEAASEQRPRAFTNVRELPTETVPRAAYERVLAALRRVQAQYDHQTAVLAMEQASKRTA